LFGCFDEEVVIGGQGDYSKKIEYLGYNTFYVFGIYALSQGDIAFLYFLYLAVVYLIERSFHYNREKEIGRLKLAGYGEMKFRLDVQVSVCGFHDSGPKICPAPALCVYQTAAFENAQKVSQGVSAYMHEIGQLAFRRQAIPRVQFLLNHYASQLIEQIGPVFHVCFSNSFVWYTNTPV
jgi:hypothetical protein